MLYVTIKYYLEEKMKKLFKSMNDSQYHFSLRKMSVGVCSVVLGLFFVGVNNAQVVKADDVKPVVAQTENLSNNNQTAGSVSKEQQVVNVKSVESKNSTKSNSNSNVAQKVEQNVETENKTSLTNSVTDQAKDNENSQKSAVTVDSKKSDKAQEQNQSAETTTFSLNDFNLDSATNNDNVDNMLLASKAMFYYVPYGGWENHNGKMYYRDWDGNYLRNQWAAPTGTTHYFGREGYTINNQWYTMPDNNTYYFDHTGHTVKNRWYTLPTNKTYYFDNTGHTVKNRWYTVSNNTTYYFDNFGHTVKNRWYTLSNSKIYYFDTFGHTVKGRWYTLTNGITYYFDTFGHTVKNRWYSIPNSSTYYFDNFGHTVKNRWYNIASGGTYYFDNEGHTVKNRYYTLNGTRYWFDGNGHSKIADRYIRQNGLTIDTKNMTLSGRRNGDSYIFVLDPSGNEEEMTSTNYDGTFEFDASKYAGETITLITRNGYSTDSREVANRQSIMLPRLSFENVKVGTNDTKISGKVNGSGWIFVLDPSGNEEEMTSTDYDGTFEFDASKYAGESIALIVRNGYHNNDREIGHRRNVTIPELNVMTLSVDTDNSYLSGKVNGSGWIFILDPSGNEEEMTSTNYDGTFSFDVSKYAGETITVLIRNGYHNDDREISNRKSIWIPYL